MSAGLHRLENSLKEFLANANSQGMSARHSGAQRYNNLRLKMDFARNPNPHFTVVVGISSATFSIESCDKMEGGLAGDERFIARWYAKGEAKFQMEEVWISLASSQRDVK